MSLNWSESKAENSPNVINTLHSAELIQGHNSFVDDGIIKAALNECIEKASSFLKKNILDDSMFLLFEWDVAHSVLTVVVTDESRTRDSEHVVKCTFSGIANSGSDNSGTDSATEEYAEQIKLWIKDYLTTCDSFHCYSLIALFHSDTRESCGLL